VPAFLGFFLTPWGAFLLAVLDNSLLFFLPLGVDAIVIILVARHREFFWLYPLITTAGSLIGAASTYWVGLMAGEKGLERFVHERKLEALKARVNKAGAIAMGLPALLPPPFPLTPFIVTCGALEVSRWRLFLAFGIARFARFFLESLLALRYGPGVLKIIEHDTFKYVMWSFFVIAFAGTAISIVMLWRRIGRGSKTKKM
jgi:membrane protein YqaA with SNARE-associated domain